MLVLYELAKGDKCRLVRACLIRVSTALWDHTQNIQDLGHEEAAKAASGIPTNGVHAALLAVFVPRLPFIARVSRWSV